MTTVAIALDLEDKECQATFAVVVKRNKSVDDQAYNGAAAWKKYKQLSTSWAIHQYTVMGGSEEVENIRVDATGSSLIRRHNRCGRFHNRSKCGRFCNRHDALGIASLARAP